MLIRTPVVAALSALALSAAPQAMADEPPVKCPPTKLNCDLTAEDPGMAKPDRQDRKPEKSGSTKSPDCVISGKKVPCSTTDLGTFNQADFCYWEPLSKPSAQDWELAAKAPDEPATAKKGALYNVACPGAGRELLGGVTWAAQAPDADGPDLQALARKAVEQMNLQGPDIGIAPKPSGMGLVGMPVWMWSKHGPTRTGPASETATAGSTTVTARAVVQTIDWDMGDGTTVTCEGPGEPYKPEYGKRQSACGHMYEQSSADQAGKRYSVQATTTWAVHWTGAGQQGDITTSRSSDTSVSIGEAQALH